MAPHTVWLTLAALIYAPGCHGLVPLAKALGSAGHSYAMLSTTHPMTTAAVTAGSILCAADLTCQCLLEPNKTSVDLQRTAALTIFGTWHYGVPAKALYLLYDQVLGTTPTLMNSIYKMLIDVYLHGPLLVIPSFYLITFCLRGQEVRSTLAQLKREWWEAAFGSVLFWTPIQLCMFYFVPQHCKVAYVAAFSFIHKTWLSWLSNRDATREVAQSVAAPKKPTDAVVSAVELPADALPAPPLPMVRHRARQPTIVLPQLVRQLSA